MRECWSSSTITKKKTIKSEIINLIIQYIFLITEIHKIILWLYDKKWTTTEKKTTFKLLKIYYSFKKKKKNSNKSKKQIKNYLKILFDS